MARRSFRGKPKKSRGANPGDMMAQFQQMQQQMAETQEQLAEESITVTVGGGAISITISGHQRVETIEVDDELIDPKEKEMLQDLLVAAVNAAIEQSQAMAAERMEGLTGGMDLGGLLGDV